MAAVVGTLREVGFDGFVNLEPMGDPAAAGVNLGALALDYFKDLM